MLTGWLDDRLRWIICWPDNRSNICMASEHVGFGTIPKKSGVIPYATSRTNPALVTVGVVDSHPQSPFFFTSHPIRSILPIRFGQNALHEPPDPKSIFEGFLLTRAQRSKIQNPFWRFFADTSSTIQNPKSILKVFSLHEEENPKSTFEPKIVEVEYHVTRLQAVSSSGRSLYCGMTFVYCLTNTWTTQVNNWLLTQH